MRIRGANLVQPFRGNLPPGWPFRLNSASDQARGLIAWYPIGIRGGNKLHDLSGRNNHLTGGAGSAEPTWREALRFVAASSQYTEIGSGLVTAAPLTLTCWVKVEDITVGQQFACLVNSGGASDWFSLMVNGGSSKLGMQLNGGGGGFEELVAATAQVSRVWYFVAAVYNSTTSRKFFLNGELQATGSTSCTPASINRFALGGLRRSSPDNYFTGEVRDARVYNRALTDAEVAAMYPPSRRWQLYYRPEPTFQDLPGPQTLAPPLLNNGVTFFTPTVSQGPITLMPPLLASTVTFFMPTVTGGLQVTDRSLIRTRQSSIASTKYRNR